MLGKIAGQGVNEVGKIASDDGLKISYHHAGTAVQTDENVDRLMADTDTAHVRLPLDPAHIVVGDDDALKLAQDHAQRIGHVHLRSKGLFSTLLGR